jgi:uncharacterized protein
MTSGRLGRTNIARQMLIGLMLSGALLQLIPARDAAAEPYGDQQRRNLATVQHGLDAWRDGTGSPYDALAEDATWEITGNSVAARLYTSKEDFLANVIRPFNARMATALKPTVRSLYADGDTVVAYFDAEGTARDGIAYRNTYAWFLHLRDDRIVAASAFFDSLAFNDLWQRVVPAPST